MRSIAAIAIFGFTAIVAVADDAAEIQKAVLDAQRAGFERHDYKRYMQQWADDAKLVLGRSDEEGKYDVILNCDQIASSRKLLFHGEPTRTLTFDESTVDVNGDSAELKLQTTIKYEKWATTIDEIYRLRKTDAGWKVVLNRAWPVVEKRLGIVVTRYDADGWKRLDEAVEDARRNGDESEVGWALISAYRFADANELARRRTVRDDATAIDWMQRSHAALTLGKTDDAISSFAATEFEDR
ncbi:MAG: nuclear transport factor 2 family protein, partial [Pirellulales bacterium]|nr:nuclear transport factor 2 family protein [Pirellulales bacterium]